MTPQTEITGIYTRSFGGEPIYIGAVQHNDPNFEQNVVDYWDEWREEVAEPEADSEFIYWLVLNKGVHYPTVQTSSVTIEV
ncbi:MAG: hypothetical protein DWQ19_08730 [Crenarchaeota archaeon]|nr:MAG: hypothetical protein DWQ19_08730 [Thermoproteota archaeon]